MRRNRGYTAFLAVCALLLVGVLLARTRPLDWRPLLRDDDTAPYDARVLAETLPKYLPGRTVKRSAVPLSDLFDTLAVPSTVVVVTPDYDAQPATLARMLGYVRRGGTVLLATEGLSTAVRDTLGLRLGGYSLGSPLGNRDTVRMRIGATVLVVPRALVGLDLYRPTDDTLAARHPGGFAFATTEETDEEAVPDSSAGYDDGGDPPPDSSPADTSRAARDPLLGDLGDPLPPDPADADSAGASPGLLDSLPPDPDLGPDSGHGPYDDADAYGSDEPSVIGLRMPLGTGQLVVFAAPRLLTNYGLLYGEGDRVLPELLAYAATAGPVVWAPGRRPNPFVEGMPLAYVLQHPAFRPAWRTALVAVFLAMAFRMRRRQRVIPVVVPPRNETVRFARVVSRLYYLRGDHAHLARTLRQQFYAYARDTLGVAAAPSDDAFASDVAARAASTPDVVTSLVARLDAAAERVTRAGLLALARDLDAFYAASPRGKP